MKIGFIGAGNMAQAIIHGLLKETVLPATDIFIANPSTLTTFTKKTGVTQVANNSALVAEVDVVILAVKPLVLPGVLTEIHDAVKKQQSLVVSIAAGVSLAELASYLEAPTPLIRVMPNVNVSVSTGVTAICKNQFASQEQEDLVTTLFEAVGSVYPLAEKDFSNFIGLAGSSPAYVYMFIDAISRAGVLNGLPKKIATEIAAKAVLGSAQRLLAGEESPWELVDQVSSPGGTTVAGVVALEEAGFIPAVIKGIDATIKKDLDSLKSVD